MEANIAARPAATDRSKCRVLACSGSLDGGGSERQLWQLVSQLDRQRFAPEVYLLSRRGPYLNQLASDIPVHAFDDQHPNPRSFPPGRISWLQARHLRGVVQSQKIDVVYDRTYHMTLVTCRLPAAVPRISVIVSPPSRDVAQNEQRFLWLKRRLLSRAYRQAAGAICVSQEVAEDAASYYGLPLQRFTVVNNPVDIEAVHLKAQGELPASANCLHQLRSGQVHAALVGRFTAEKGHAFAIELAARWLAHTRASSTHSQLHLHFVGSGPLEKTISHQAERLQLSHQIHFHGYQTNPYPILAACDLALIPSRYEGFPNVALEAMALGVPVLMTRYGATADQLAGTNQQRAILIAPDDFDGAISALTSLVEHPGTWQARAALAKQWVASHHALAPWMEEMSQLLLRYANRGAV